MKLSWWRVEINGITYAQQCEAASAAVFGALKRWENGFATPELHHIRCEEVGIKELFGYPIPSAAKIKEYLESGKPIRKPER